MAMNVRIGLLSHPDWQSLWLYLPPHEDQVGDVVIVHTHGPKPELSL